VVEVPAPVSPDSVITVPQRDGEQIDHASPVPFYEQLAVILRREITSGRMPPGKIEGGEDGLARRYGVSRPTARRALDELKAEGLVATSRSKGTYVLRQEDRPR